MNVESFVLLKFWKQVCKDIILQRVSLNFIVSILVRALVYPHTSFVNSAQEGPGFVCLCGLHFLEIFATALWGRGGNPRQRRSKC